jgi:beta-galactosidase
MHKYLLPFLLMALFSCRTEQNPRNTLLFNDDWRFHRGDVAEAGTVGYDHQDWRILSLPHDWSIEDIPGTDSPLDSNAVGSYNTGFFVGGTAWYRKSFTIPKEQANKRFYIQFDGVYMNADIWLNGTHLGNHPYGYTTFGYEITDNLQAGKENILAVQVKNEGANSRWYTGSGIYRHVWLISTEKVFIPTWGVGISTPVATSDSAAVEASVKVANRTESIQDLQVLSVISDQDGREVAKSKNLILIEANSELEISQLFEITQPLLWSPESPSLYKLTTTVLAGARTIDQVENTFGIRSLHFSVEQGFLLNGVPTLLKGGCMHHDNGPLGAAAFDRAEERRVELMKASGFNAIRCSHNPPSVAFLDACDRLGILVIDETFDMWRKQKNPQDYHLYFDEWWERDVASMVLRDRNHPSIIMWSIGNEIPERGEPEGAQTSKIIGEYVRQLDPTRPVTAAVNGLSPDKDPYFATLDISGYNYAAGGDHWKSDIYALDHERVPDRIIYGAESYPLDAFGAWMGVLDNTFVIGDFVWTGFDYLGESSIGSWGYMLKREYFPWSHAYCGDIDICGWKQPQSYYRDVLWENGNKPHIVVVPPIPSFTENPDRMNWSKWHWDDVVKSWNWKGFENREIEVHVYNRSQSVELIHNGKSLGKKETNRDNKWIVKWTVQYQPGSLEAVSYDGENVLSSDKLETAGEPTSIKLIADRPTLKADGQDLCFIEVALVDDAGNRNPTAEHLVSFSVDGPGEIIAVGSSNPVTRESFKKPFRRTYQGRCLLIVRVGKAPGNIGITATSEKLPGAGITIMASGD